MKTTHLVLLALILGCSSPQRKSAPANIVPPQPKRSGIILRQIPVFQPAAGQPILIRWQYPPNATNWWWDLQVTTNFVTWQTLATKLGPNDITVTNEGGNKFFRMRGWRE